MKDLTNKRKAEELSTLSVDNGEEKQTDGSQVTRNVKLRIEEREAETREEKDRKRKKYEDARAVQLRRARLGCAGLGR